MKRILPIFFCVMLGVLVSCSNDYEDTLLKTLGYSFSDIESVYISAEEPNQDGGIGFKDVKMDSCGFLKNYVYSEDFPISDRLHEMYIFPGTKTIRILFNDGTENYVYALKDGQIVTSLDNTKSRPDKIFVSKKIVADEVFLNELLQGFEFVDFEFDFNK